jgi:hypothetical protein
MALVLGRPDLRTHFHVRGRTNWDAALRWLILHGVRELELWPFFSGQFVNQLRAATVLMRGRRISPLMASVLAERPDVAALWRECAADRLAALFADWFIGNGVREYGLDWLLTGREVAQVIALAAQLPATPAAEGLLFPDGPSAPPAAALLARSPTLPHYRSFGADYPCAFLDIEAPANAIRAISAGEVRPGLRGGLELLSRYTAIALPHARGAAMLVLLDFAGSAVAPRGTWVRLRIRDEQDAPCCERTLPAAALAEGRLTLRLLSTGLRLRLEIAFARPGVPPAADDPSTQAVLRSLCVWQVAA